MSNHTESLSAQEALKKLQEGNEKYLTAASNPGDISLKIRENTHAFGQHPYAIVITCADSRVIPESIFMAGIGELFVIRVAGNVIGDHQLGSVEYAADHLGCQLAIVLGHSSCGAVGAAIGGHVSGFIQSITDEIKSAIGDETNDYKACCLNVRHGVEKIKSGLKLPSSGESGLKVVGAVYHIEDGHVEFLA